MKSSNLFYLSVIFTLIGVVFSNSVYAQTTELEWHSFEQALKLAEEEGKPIMVDVWAPWCGWCKKMKKEVYPELSAALSKDFVLTRLNRDDNEDKKTYQQYRITPLRLAQKFGVQNVPAIVFLSPEGEYLFHISGFVEADELKEILGYVSVERAERL
ncbi:MAG: thioredoxin family protein [Gracilimonas sp.]|uniref:thioredoxin family protein n=1 Tax=Gracilimonas TaxID=649462 RepID=UPI001B0725A7|nr:thioredoxin family protein [Gracilimonas sp.]MBO6585448.1 thioredoxin family protein [Gracilimonas sp.]MBO6616444.1 thioredoxin family protein [Gracilimonas sp.]